MSPREDRTTTVSAMKGWLLEATYLLRVADSTKSWPNVTVTHFSSKAEQLVNVAVNARVFTFSVVLVRSAFGVRRIRAFPNFHQQIQEDLDYQHLDFVIGHLGIGCDCGTDILLPPFSKKAKDRIKLIGRRVGHKQQDEDSYSSADSGR